MSLIFLAVPSLLIGISGYYSSTRSLNELGAKGLQTNVRMTIEMIEALDKQVKAGKIPLKEAQEQVKEAILGKKDNRGKRPINRRLTQGKDDFIFIVNSQGVELAHPNFEGENVWDIKTTDGVYSTQEVVKAANNGGGLLHMNGHCPITPISMYPKLLMRKKNQIGVGLCVQVPIYRTLM